MSAGGFSLSKYQMDGGQIVPVRVQPETLTFTSGGNANAAPTGDVTLNLFAKTRKGTREYGIGCRTVTISWDGTPPTDYKDDNLTIPILDETVFDGYTVGTAATYLSTACVIVSKKDESLR